MIPFMEAGYPYYHNFLISFPPSITKMTYYIRNPYYVLSPLNSEPLFPLAPAPLRYKNGGNSLLLSYDFLALALIKHKGSPLPLLLIDKTALNRATFSYLYLLKRATLYTPLPHIHGCSVNCFAPLRATLLNWYNLYVAALY